MNLSAVFMASFLSLGLAFCPVGDQWDEMEVNMKKTHSLCIGMGIENWFQLRTAFKLSTSSELYHSELINLFYWCRHILLTVEHCKSMISNSSINTAENLQHKGVMAERKNGTGINKIRHFHPHCCTVTKTINHSKHTERCYCLITFPYKYHLVFAMIQDEALIWEQVTLEEWVFLLRNSHFHGPWRIRYLVTYKHANQLAIETKREVT